MGHGSYQGGRAWRGRMGLCALALVLLGAGQAFAQLTPEDIEALRQRGEAEGWTFEVGENAATSISLEDLCGLKVPPDWQEGARFDPGMPVRDLPARFDWRDYGGCPPVRNQSHCGSCWAFATVGPLECNIRIRHGDSVDLSEQWLVSCNSDGWGCNGGWWAHDYHEWKTDPCGGTGAVREFAFPYTATDAPCDCPYPHEYLIDSWAYLGDGVAPVEVIKQAIYDYGPACVGVYVDSAFQGYRRGVFNACSNGQVNHGVVLVGWDDNQGPNGVWFLRNSWGSGWGENGYMRIEYDCSRVGYAASYVDYGSSRPTLTFEYPDGRPEVLEPGVAAVFRVNVSADTGTPVPGTGWLHYSRNGGESYFVVGLNERSPNEYEAVLPGMNCFTRVDWYVSVEEETIGRVKDPVNAPFAIYSSLVDSYPMAFWQYDFETEQGWTVDPGASEGNWERADPEEVILGGADPVVTQPADDHSPDGTLCYVTGAAAGADPWDNDVDGAATHLFSPVLQLAGQDAIVGYWRWFHISDQWDDALAVRVSNDNGASWVLVEKIFSREEWTYSEFRVRDYVTPTDEVLVRFTVADRDPSSLVEALIDDVTVTVLDCVSPEDCPEDLNRDGIIDLQDLSQLLGNYGTTSGAEHADGDIDGDSDVDLADLSTLLAVYGTACE
jgi:hypothetical protein